MKKELDTIQKAELLGLGYSGGFTIGDLIEWLMEHDKHRTYISWDTTPPTTTWFGRIEQPKKGKGIIFRDGYGYGELVDTLHEAVRDTLKK